MHCTKNPWFLQSLAFFWRKVSFSPPLHQESLVFKEFPSSDANLPLFFDIYPWFSQEFPSSDVTFPKCFHSFGPVAPGILGFLQDLPSSDAKFLHCSTFLALLHQKSVGFHRISPRLMQHFVRFSFGPTPPRTLGFHWIFNMFGPTAPNMLGGFSSSMLSHDFSSSDAKFPTCAHNYTTMVPAESAIICRYSDSKQFCSVKLFLTYSKINPPAYIYVRLFLHIRKFTAQNKGLCM